jgi:Spy/CpxP family protein refolding chaperone
MSHLTRMIPAGVLSGVLCALVAVAAEPPAADGPRARARGEAAQLDRGALDDKQRTLLREAMQAHRDELQQWDGKLQAAQKDLMKVVLVAKPDLAAVREKAEAVAKVQVELTVVRAKIAAVIVPTLTPEQREQFENSPVALMMLGGGMRGPLGRGPMGQGGNQRPGGGAQGRGRGGPPP